MNFKRAKITLGVCADKEVIEIRIHAFSWNVYGNFSWERDLSTRGAFFDINHL